MTTDRMGGFADAHGLRGTLFHPKTTPQEMALEVFSRLFQIEEIKLGPYQMKLIQTPLLPDGMFALIDGHGELQVFRLDEGDA